jgi:PAS domain S-box-containing protein
VPRDLGSYAYFVRWVCENDDGRLTHVQLWNEPTTWCDWDRDADRWWTRFAAMIRFAAAEAKAAGERAGERLSALDAKAQSLRTELTASTERLEAIGGRVERLGKDVVEAGQAASAALEAHGTELRAELAAVRRVAEEARDGLDALRTDLETVREESKSVSQDAAGARSAAEAGERKVEAMASELRFALKQLEDVKAGLTSAGQAAVIARREAEQAKKAAQSAGEGSSERVTEVFQQILGLASARGGAGGAQRRHSTTPGSQIMRKPEIVKREPRHGFDDVATPMAVLGLDGKFKELNPAFARLVGYQEHEFAKAAWPSPHDRKDYKEQLEQLRQLGTGELGEIPVQSTYMHGQGLMVPVVGKLSAVAGEDGLPLHLLLEAEARQTH